MLSRKGMKLIVTLGLLAFSPFLSYAHHSRAHYSEEIQEINGELLELIWRNPHAGFTLAVETRAGEREIWEVESWSSPYVMSRMGVSNQLFRIGDQIRVAGRLSTRRSRNLLAINVLLPNGDEVVLAANAGPYWSGDHVGGLEQWSSKVASPEVANAVDAGIFRVWSIDYVYGEQFNFAFTEEALETRAEWNDLDNFMVRCESAGMPYSMRMPFPFEFVDEGTRIILRVEYMDTVRTIHMDVKETPVSVSATPSGYSIGSWEGDTLIVDTDRIRFPYFDDLGTPQSEAIEVREEFTLSEDRTSLKYTMMITDPATFTEPATVYMERLDLGETVKPFDCRPG